RACADRSGKNYPGPIVFEGDAPANVRENAELAELLSATALVPVPVSRIWLGAPNSIKGPTEAAFNRQSGNNLLIVGQRDEAALAILTVALVSLSAQHSARQARFLVFDASAPGSPERDYVERLAVSLPTVTLVKPGDLADLINGLAEDLKRRSDGESGDAL